MKRIFLIGFMGCGKSTIGKKLAQTLHLQFIDLDTYIEQRYHDTISELFQQDGEAHFRQLEQRMLHEVAQFENVVIATGGGTPCFFDNMDQMLRMGTVLFIDYPIPILVERLKKHPYKRPLIAAQTSQQVHNYIAQLLEQRLPVYQRADICYRPEHKDLTQVITELTQLLAFDA